MSTRLRSAAPLLASAAAALAVLAACTGSGGYGATSSSTTAVAAAAGIRTGHTSAGTVLVDSRGRTMYAFAADSKGRSACTGSCLTYWPPVRVGAHLPARAGGVTARLGVLHRPDGTAQLTVAGWPMYTYVGDTSRGAATGQGKNLSGGRWWVVAPSGAWVRHAATTGGGKASY